MLSWVTFIVFSVCLFLKINKLFLLFVTTIHHMSPLYIHMYVVILNHHCIVLRRCMQSCFCYLFINLFTSTVEKTANNTNKILCKNYQAFIFKNIILYVFFELYTTLYFSLLCFAFFFLLCLNSGAKIFVSNNNNNNRKKKNNPINVINCVSLWRANNNNR